MMLCNINKKKHLCGRKLCSLIKFPTNNNLIAHDSGTTNKGASSAERERESEGEGERERFLTLLLVETF